jgi:hypothetical protein
MSLRFTAWPLPGPHSVCCRPTSPCPSCTNTLFSPSACTSAACQFEESPTNVLHGTLFSTALRRKLPGGVARDEEVVRPHAKLVGHAARQSVDPTLGVSRATVYRVLAEEN